MSILVALTATPALLGTQEAIRQSQQQERREEHRARRCNLIARCVKPSVRAVEINGRPLVLRNGAVFVDTGTGDDDEDSNDHLYAGYYLPYPDATHEGLVTTITDEAPVMNWVYVDAKTHQLKYGVRKDAQDNITGSFDCTRQDRRLTLLGWEGFCAVETEPGIWAVYFDVDDNGLRGKVHVGTRVLDIELQRCEKRWKKEASARMLDQTTERDTENVVGAQEEAERPAPFVEPIPTAPACLDSVGDGSGGTREDMLPRSVPYPPSSNNKPIATAAVCVDLVGDGSGEAREDIPPRSVLRPTSSNVEPIPTAAACVDLVGDGSGEAREDISPTNVLHPPSADVEPILTAPICVDSVGDGSGETREDVLPGSVPYPPSSYIEPIPTAAAACIDLIGDGSEETREDISLTSVPYPPSSNVEASPVGSVMPNSQSNPEGTRRSTSGSTSGKRSSRPASYIRVEPPIIIVPKVKSRPTLRHQKQSISESCRGARTSDSTTTKDATDSQKVDDDHTDIISFSRPLSSLSFPISRQISAGTNMNDTSKTKIILRRFSGRWNGMFRGKTWHERRRSNLV